MQARVERYDDQPGYLVQGEHFAPSGIQELPAETLSTIFSNLIDDSYESTRLKYQNDTAFNPHRDLIVASHICQQWRYVALNTASLWKHVSIAYNHYSHVEALLLRSKSARLSVNIAILYTPTPQRNWRGPPHPNLSVALNLVTANWHRVASLSLYFQEANSDYAWILQKWLKSVNPGRDGPSVLQILRIHGWVLFEISFLSPKLPQLALAKGLTELSLDKIRLETSLIPHGLYELIRSSPNIEVLRLCIKYEYDDEEPIFDQTERISLPHLRQLFLTFRPHSVINHLLLDMDFPQDTYCEFTYDSITTLGALQCLPHNITSRLQTFEMTISMDRVILRAMRSVGDATPSEVNITVIPRPPEFERVKCDLINVLIQCLDSMPWTRPVSLNLDLSEVKGSTPNAQDWFRFAICLPALESLEICITNSSGQEEEQSLLVLLEGFDIGQEEPCCPRLHQLVLPTLSTDQTWEGLSVMLAECNKRRNNLGLPSMAVTFLGRPTKVEKETIEVHWLFA